MPTLKIEFSDDETTPERLQGLARETGLTQEELVRRAIADFLADYRLKTPPEEFKPNTLRDLFVGYGVIKDKD